MTVWYGSAWCRWTGLWREHLNPGKASKVLLIVGIDAGDAVGHHRGHKKEVKDLLAGYLGMVLQELDGVLKSRIIGIYPRNVVGTSLYFHLCTSRFG